MVRNNLYLEISCLKAKAILCNTFFSFPFFFCIYFSVYMEVREQLSTVTSLLPPSESGVKLRLSLFIINVLVELTMHFLSLIFPGRSLFNLIYNTPRMLVQWASGSRLAQPYLTLYTCVSFQFQVLTVPLGLYAWVLRIRTQELLITWQTLIHLSSVPCVVLVHCILCKSCQICLLDDLCIASWWNSKLWNFWNLACRYLRVHWCKKNCSILLTSVILSPGEAYMRLSKLPEAEHWYMESLRSKTDHIPAHLTYGKLLALTVSTCHLNSPEIEFFPCVQGIAGI